MSGTTTIQYIKAHVALNVKNVETSIEFYKKMFGIEPSKVRTDYAKFDVQNPPLNFTLNQVPFGERGALSHMGIQVASTEDVLAMREQWHEQGLYTRDEMQTNCCYAFQDKTWVNDPDGNEWEVFVVLEDNLPETSMCCVTNDAGQTACATSDVAPVLNNLETSTVALSSVANSCACEETAPATGEAACCDTQAAKFGISEIAPSNSSCCALVPVGISKRSCPDEL